MNLTLQFTILSPKVLQSFIAHVFLITFDKAYNPSPLSNPPPVCQSVSVV